MDETARILAEGGRPVAIAEYAIHEAHRLYRETADGTSDPEALAVARNARREALARALAAFDADKEPGEYETFPVRQARTFLGSREVIHDRRLTPGEPVLSLSCPSHATGTVTGYMVVRTSFPPGQAITLTDLERVDCAENYGTALGLVHAERERLADSPHEYAVIATLYCCGCRSDGRVTFREQAGA
jgi:hypothetical protein